MRLVECITSEHVFGLVAVAALMCMAGAWVTMRLGHRACTVERRDRFYWCFLAAVTAGASVWATHFIAMLGYRTSLPVSIDGPMTIGSILIAIFGMGIGFALSCLADRRVAAAIGGTAIGLAITAMHYVGMLAYRIDGVVRWDASYVVVSVGAAITLSILAVDRLRRTPADALPVAATALLVGAIVLLHFCGMAAMTVVPLNGVRVVDTEGLVSLAMAIAMVALVVIATGISTHLLQDHWQVSSQEQLRHIALHDALTGLWNRRRFNEALRARCAASARQGAFALLLIDLDRFKPVNDTLGHPVGDEVLRRVAARLAVATQGEGLLARIGGDEFAILVDCEDRHAPAPHAIADRIIDLAGRPLLVDGKAIEIGASVGIARAVGGELTPQEMTQRADMALYTAKQSGLIGSAEFEPGMMEATQARHAFEADLRRATARDEFEVVYQPFVTAEGRFGGAEALVRWTRPDHGPVPPIDFIPLAEQLGLIGRIGAHVLREACTTAARWPGNLKVAVNVSPVQLLDPRLPELVAEILIESGLAPDRLELEITETALFGDDALALQSLRRLAAQGIAIALDDFGTGFASLSHLHRFPISRIKIDRSFVQQLPHDGSSASIVRAIAQLGESLGMEITAEGVETIEQRDFMIGQGCEHLQGYVFSRPIGSGAVAAMFAAETHGRAAA